MYICGVSFYFQTPEVQNIFFPESVLPMWSNVQTDKHIVIAIHNVGGLPLAHYRQRLDIYSRCACNVDTHHDGEILIIITRYLICGEV